MDTQKVKTLLIKLFGYKLTAVLQGVRFARLLKNKTETEPELKILDKFLKPGDAAIDVGANGADWTYALYSNVGQNGIVFAFEADPYYALSTSIAIKLMKMKNVEFFACGLSDKEETVPLRIKDPNGLRSSGLGFIDKENTTNEGVALVHLKTLDSFIDKHPEILKTALLKVDVEGYELFVLKGAVKVLKQARPVVFFETGNFEKQGYKAEDLHSFIKQLEYKAYALIDNESLREVDSSLMHPRALGPNRILLPMEKIDSYKFSLS
ncbi:MAG: FkbM family methyltransferase [Bacteroidota bacterium]|nr:FkbM family methyltransferase [Bacteroidota bacterium]